MITKALSVRRIMVDHVRFPDNSMPCMNNASYNGLLDVRKKPNQIQIF